MRLPPHPIEWEYETIRDVPPFAYMDVVATHLGILMIIMLITGLI